MYTNARRGNVVRRVNDPQRREEVAQTALDAVIAHGIHRVTHRKIAMIAEVPLGPMAYYFSRIDEFLMEASGCFTDGTMLQCQDLFADVKDALQACHTITDMIYGSQVATSDSVELMYQLHAFASRRPTSKTVVQNWMLRSQQALEQWFDPITAWALDAFIEGVTLHFVTDKKPLQREDILLMVERIARIPTTISCA